MKTRTASSAQRRFAAAGGVARLEWLVATVLAACGGRVDTDQLAAGATRSQDLFYDRAGIWPTPSISVCWEDLTDSTADQRSWVQQAVNDAFEVVSAVQFTGWGACAARGADVVLRVGNSEWPRALVGQRAASATPSVFFNFFTDQAKDLDVDGNLDFQTCYSSASYKGLTGRTWNTHQEYCIQVIAVHEFAHVLGVEHEQNRPDTPSYCASSPDSSSDSTLAYWDLTSVSNYCDPVWSNDGRLSPLDAIGIRSLYGTGENTLVWLGLGNVRNYAHAPADQINFAIWGTSIMDGFTPIGGDFDGDGRTDVYWYNPASSDAFWWSNGDGSFTGKRRETQGGFQPFAGDFDGDGNADVFLYGLSGPDYILWGSADRKFTTTSVDAYDVGFVPVVGDFDGDGKDDIFWYSPLGTDYFWWSNADRTFARQTWQMGPGYIPFAGDFDGDGDADIFLNNPNGASRIWRSNGDRTFTGLESQPVPNARHTAVGDFDGDGIDDILWIGSDNALWLMRSTLGTYISTPMITEHGSVPVKGDFNGDGLGDLIWYNGD